MSVNLMQLAAAFNTVGNGGLYLRPTMVAEAVDGEGHVHPISEPVRRQVITPRAAAETLEMLTAVTGEGGTGVKARIDGYTVAGKTGTAWKVFDNGSGRLTYGTENDRRYLTTFGGLVPAEVPELSVVLMIDEPRTATSATTASAPAFAEIAQYALRVLNIAPVNDGDEVAGWRASRVLVRGTPAAADDGPRPGGDTVPDPATSDQEAPLDPTAEVAPLDATGTDDVAPAEPTVAEVDLAPVAEESES
jgi:cell division protein FtsI (penicillin-binding protein 3)